MKKEGNLNEEIAKIFYEMADILEVQNVMWKPQAYRTGAQSIESGRDVSEIYSNEGIKGLKEIPGIGEELAKKIIEYIETGKILSYEKMKKAIPKGLYEMMNIPGVGVKRAGLFYNKLGIKSIRELKKAAEEHKLIGEGLKEKTEKNILDAISLANRKRILLKDAEKIAEGIVSELRKVKEVKKAEVAGSVRRKKATIGDIDIVVMTNEPEKVADEFVKMDFVKKVIGKGKEKATVITKDDIQADLRFFSEEEYGAGLLYFTGDKQHNIWLRRIAIKKGMKLNEYGLFEIKSRKRVAGRTEEEVYSKLGLKFVEPERRLGEV